MLIQNNYRPINSQIIKKNPQLSSINARDNISFCGKKGVIAAAALGALGGLGWWGKVNLDMHEQLLSCYPDLYNFNQPDVMKSSGWDSNVRVLASTGQNVYGIGSEEDGYSSHLAKGLQNAGISTLEQVNDSLSKSGYRLNREVDLSNFEYLPCELIINNYLTHKTLFPLETYGQKLNIFNKNDKTKERFVLTLSSSENPKFASASVGFANKLKDTYKIPSENIVNMRVSTFEDFKKGIDSIKGKIRDVNNSELVILCRGDANTYDADSVAQKIEGAKEGFFINDKISESSVKSLLHEKLGGTKTLFIMDACHSGAWIADKAKHALNQLV